MEKSDLLKKCAFILIISIVLMTVFSIMVKYDVEGEKGLPFEIKKILLVSTVDGDKKEDNENIWNIDVTGVNDVYIYINKNTREDINIKSIKLDNFNLEETPQKGNIKILRPTGDLPSMYRLSEQDYMHDSITYLGGPIDNLKALEVCASGGIIGFRASINDLGSFISNEAEEIIYDGHLLSNLEIKEEELKCKVNFDIIIETTDGVSYKGNVSLDIPVEGFIEKGTASIEITDTSNIIFKRL